MDSEVVEVLIQIRDEIKQTNARLDQVNERLDQTNARVDQTNERLDQTNARLDQTNARLDQTIARLDQTNERLDQTIARLDLLDGRVLFFEKRVSKGFAKLTERIDSHAERLDLLAQRRNEGELRLASEIRSLAGITREVRELLALKLDDHQKVIEHDQRIRSLEDRIADRPTDSE